MVRPLTEYGNVVWGPSYQGDKMMLEKVQRRATKMIKELKDIPYADRLQIYWIYHPYSIEDFVVTWSIPIR